MQCFKCRKETDWKCKVCTIPYCSKLCRKRDSHNHMVFCHPKLHQRIKSIIDYVIENIRGNHWNISYGFSGIDTIEKHKVYLSPYGELHNKIRCAFCGGDPLIQSYENCPRIMYRNCRVDYCICVNCKDKVLCPATFADTRECARHYDVNKMLTFLMCLKRLAEGNCKFPDGRSEKRLEEWNDSSMTEGSDRQKYPRVPKDIKQMIFAEVVRCNHSTLQSAIHHIEK